MAEFYVFDNEFDTETSFRIYVLFSGKFILIYGEGLLLDFMKWFWKTLFLPTHLLCFSPLQVLGSSTWTATEASRQF